MSFRGMVSAVLFLGVFAMAARVSIDTDTWWHLRAGQWMVEHRQILRTDPFSLTRQGEPWVYPGWLAQLVLYGVFQAAGYAGLNLLTAVMVALGLWCVWRVMDGPVLLRPFGLVLAAATSAVFWSARPQIFSFALTGAFVAVLERFRGGGRWGVVLLPLLMALWVNLHGGFAIGFLLLLAHTAGLAIDWFTRAVVSRADLRHVAMRRLGDIARLVGVGLACALAVALNPHGPVMLLYPFKTVSIAVLQRFIQEWQSPDFHRLEAQPFLWMLFAVFLAMISTRRTVSATDVALVVGFGYLGFLAGRNIATFALAAAPVLARHAASALEPLSRLGARSKPFRPALGRALNAVLVVLVAAAAAVKVGGVLDARVNEEVVDRRFPDEAARYIAEHRPRGPLFNSYNWGGYVLWSLYPEYQTFVDGRTDLFDDEILTEYLQAWTAGEGWEEVLARWGINLVLIEPEAPLALALGFAGWDRLYEDEQAVVFARAGQ